MPEQRSVVVAGRTPPRGAYPHLRIVGDLVFVSGTSSRRVDGTFEGATVDNSGHVTLDVKVQTRAVLDNIAALLGSVGLSLADLVDVTSFLVTMDDFDGYNEVYAEYFSAESGPARTTVAVHQLPHPHLAIEITLTLGMDRRLVVHTPLMWTDKAGTFALAQEIGGKKFLDLVVEETHSCYLGDRSRRHDWGYGCGECPACQLRAAGWDGWMSNRSSE